MGGGAEARATLSPSPPHNPAHRNSVVLGTPSASDLVLPKVSACGDHAHSPRRLALDAQAATSGAFKTR